MELKGAYIIEIEKMEDERGFFGRIWDEAIFKKMNLSTKIIQCNISFNIKKGTLRGIHYQAFPYEEVKVIRCTKGKVYEILVDLRPTSNTFKQWRSIELSQNDSKLLYVPEGFGLGMQTLENNTELVYLMSQKFMPEFSRGIKFDDPIFKFKWPLDISIISKKDSSFDLFND